MAALGSKHRRESCSRSCYWAPRSCFFAPASWAHWCARCRRQLPSPTLDAAIAATGLWAWLPRRSAPLRRSYICPWTLPLLWCLEESQNGGSSQTARTPTPRLRGKNILGDAARHPGPSHESQQPLAQCAQIKSPDRRYRNAGRSEVSGIQMSNNGCQTRVALPTS